MHLEPHSLLVSYGHFSRSISYCPYSTEITVTLPFDLTRLYQEKHILSKGLADCVTYLEALRVKQAKCSRQLDVQPSLQHKKRKRLQQTKRYLDNEIKTRQLAEKAYLNNLQACETNIYLANFKAYQLVNAPWYAPGLISSPTLYTPTLCSNAETEMTDLTWEGWTDAAVVSPFQMKSSTPFFGDDLAPDACTEDLRRDSAVAKDVKRPPPLIRDAVELSNSLPIPPNTARTQYSRSSSLSPAAGIFSPTVSSVVIQSSHDQPNSERLSLSSSVAVETIELLQQRRSSAAEIIPMLESCDILAQQALHYPSAQQAWSHAAPHSCPQKAVRLQMNRDRTKSL